LNFELDMNINGENPNSEVVTGETLATTSEKGFSKYSILRGFNFVK